MEVRLPNPTNHGQETALRNASTVLVLALAAALGGCSDGEQGEAAAPQTDPAVTPAEVPPPPGEASPTAVPAEARPDDPNTDTTAARPGH